MKRNLYNSLGPTNWTFRMIGFKRRYTVKFELTESRTLFINSTW